MNAAVPTLVKMCSAAEDITSIVDANNTSGLVTIIATITNHPEYTQSTEAGMGLLAKMAASQKKDNKDEVLQSPPPSRGRSLESRPSAPYPQWLDLETEPSLQEDRRRRLKHRSPPRPTHRLPETENNVMFPRCC